MIFSGNNTIPILNHKQDGLLFKTSGLKKDENFWKDIIAQFAWNSVSLLFTDRLPHVPTDTTSPLVQNLNRKGENDVSNTTPAFPSPTVRLFPASWEPIPCVLFPSPLSIGKANVIAHWKQKWHQQWQTMMNFSVRLQKGIWCNNLETKLKRTLTILLSLIETLFYKTLSCCLHKT